MNCFALLLIGFFIGCLFGGIISFIFFVKKIAEYKRKNK
jgi:MFS superfamily sulfate permease-like transporter